MKQHKSWHTPKSSRGSGDSYGTGIKAKIGRIRDIYPVDGFNKPSKNTGKPPKSFA